jgi:CBS domain-containing protein
MNLQSTDIRKVGPRDSMAFSRPIQGMVQLLRKRRLHSFLTLQTNAAMTKDVLAVPPWMTLGELEGLFEAHDFNGFPVVEGRHLIGILTKFDFLKTFIFTPDSIVPPYDKLMKRTVEEIMTREVCTVHPSTPLPRVLQMMVEMRNQSFPVVDESNCLLGMISRGDIIRALKG